jgi:hypothetical protein
MWASPLFRSLAGRSGGPSAPVFARGTTAFALALLVAFAERPDVAYAEPDRAAQLFDVGVADLKLEKYEAACAALEESYGLDANIGTLIALGDCLERWGKLRSAAVRFEELIAAVSSADPAASAYRAPQLEYARAALARLTPQIPRLALAWPAPVAPDVCVLLDGQALATAAEQEVGVDPGRHSIETQAPERDPWRIELDLSAGEHRRVELQLGRPLEPEPEPAPLTASVPPASTPRVATSPLPKPERAAAPLAPTAAPDSNAWRSVGWGLGGLGITGIGVGAVAGIMVLEVCPGLHCEGDRGKHLALVTDVGFGVGLAALATSVYLLLETEPSPQRAQSASWRPLGGLDARGGWLGVGRRF